MGAPGCRRESTGLLAPAWRHAQATDLMTVVDAALAEEAPRTIEVQRSFADRVYRGVALGSGLMTLVTIALICLFLVVQSWPAIERVGIWDFLTTKEWNVTAAEPVYGAAALLYGTVLIATIALVIAIPLSVGAALFINEYAPRTIRKWLTSMIDLLAAIPSVIYGMWGVVYLAPRMVPTVTWMADYLGFIPFFAPTSRTFQGTVFNAGVVVSFMVLPIVTSVVREVFSQAPRGEVEAALALGSTRWGMIRTVILPFGRGGIVGGSMLGLGRALGETIAVVLLLPPTFDFVTRILEPGGVSTAAWIALQFQNAGTFEVKALLAAGLALFIMTLMVNMAATAVVNRSRGGQGVEL
jgi:phosphate transport system permease protein